MPVFINFLIPQFLNLSPAFASALNPERPSLVYDLLFLAKDARRG